MGWGSFTKTDWNDFTSTHTRTASGAAKSREEIFSRSDINPDFDPRKIKVRESCDSADNPESTPIIVALDVTGSMGFIPERMIKDDLGRLVTTIINDKPVPNPHVMFMAVGDVKSDSAPLQATQFEADIRIASQLKELFLEGGGGGNLVESYDLPWYFAANKTKIDSFDKRGRKGILFTVGDEGVPPSLSREEIRQVFGDKVPKDLSAAELIKKAEERYDVFHLIVQEGDNYRRHGKFVEESWKAVLGERAILVKDYRKIPEVIVSTLASLQSARSVPQPAAQFAAKAGATDVTTAIAGLKGKTGAPKMTLVAA